MPALGAVRAPPVTAVCCRTQDRAGLRPLSCCSRTRPAGPGSSRAPRTARAPLRSAPLLPGPRHARGSGMRQQRPLLPAAGPADGAKPPVRTARAATPTADRPPSAPHSSQPPPPHVTLRPSLHPAGPGLPSCSPVPGAGSPVARAGDAARLREMAGTAAVFPRALGAVAWPRSSRAVSG